ncbi:hypothetical protein ORJ00_03370 [Rheinheimera baltica]|uniref:hypothetical protein n=1 Tax=Rheinheimera baltica TaxID=67576 RepID=UPI00273F5313|nr:hypothetical protein [Rheinheimera baltica]MDP5141781.1 hypothetical protein [Rheinheimera baltica]
MPINDPAWQHYLSALERGSATLASNDDTVKLISLSHQLSAQRLALPAASVTLWQQPIPLPSTVLQLELLLLLCQHYRWPDDSIQLVLQAGFCSVLATTMPQVRQWPKLQRYPALAAARLLQGANNSTALHRVLAGCYPTERNIAPWQQQPLSLLLTEVEYLTRPNLHPSLLLQHIGQRISQTKSEYEISLLRHILTMFCHSQTPLSVNTDRSDLITNSRFRQLYQANTGQLVEYLSQSSELAAPLLALASQLNRQQQQIHDIRLALNLIGSEQVPYVLAESELHSSMAQLHHPKHALLHQFSACLGHTINKLLPGRARSRALALCLCAPLWLEPHSYNNSLLQRCTQGVRPALDFSCYNNSSTLSFLLALLDHYHLNEWIEPVRLWLQSLQQNIPTAGDINVLTLQLAWHSNLVLFANLNAQPLIRCLQHAKQKNISDTGSPANWLMQLATDSQCYFPLALTL